MPLNNVHTFVLAALTVTCSAILQYHYPEHSFIAFGFILALLITFFNGNLYTIIVGVACAILIGIVAFNNSTQIITVSLFSRQMVSFFIIIITTLLTVLLKEQNKSISRTKKYYTNVFEHASEGIILADNNTSMYLVNPKAREMFGYLENEMIGQPIEMLIPSKYHERHKQHLNNFYQHLQVRQMGAGRDLKAIKKNGTEFPVEVSLSYFKVYNKTFVIAFVMDITLRKEAEEHLLHVNAELLQSNKDINKLNEELETKVLERTLMLQEALQQVENSLEKEKELSDIKSRFVSLASHEFRTPLSTVLFSASLLGKYVTTDDQHKRTMHVLKIKNAVKHLNNILEDFLNLGKLNEGQIQPTIKQFSVKETIIEVLEELRELLKNGQEFILDCPNDLTIYSDSRFLNNILINIISNAIKYSPENSGIIIRTSYQEMKLTLEIIDTGIGIPEDDKQYLFTSFYRGKNVLNIKGTGLGLHIVKRYLDILGAKIMLQSMVNMGTTVTIIIPDHSNFFKP